MEDHHDDYEADEVVGRFGAWHSNDFEWMP
jgi:hypothetical protein